MKITIEHFEHTNTWESESEGHDLTEVVQQIKGLLVAAGFHPENVDDHFVDDTYTWFPERADSYKHCSAQHEQELASDKPKQTWVNAGLRSTPIPKETDFDGIHVMMSDPYSED